MSNVKVYKGNIVFAPSIDELKIIKDGYIVVKDGVVVDTYEELPNEYSLFHVTNYRDHLIIPGFVDLHLHAPQFANRGLGLDMELLDWLDTYTFPEESKYKDLAYAKEAYENFVAALARSATTRSVIFGTIDLHSTEMLMDLINTAGLGAYVGKVNMDRNSPDFYIEDTEKSILDTEKFILNTKDKYSLVKPIITPRFVPSCSPELMKELGSLARKFDLKIQSHLSENRGEVEWVKELHPEAKSYAEVYDNYGLFGNDVPTIMAHCVWNTEEEMELMAKNKVFVAHSPYSNTNLSSGIAPVREFLSKGIPVGLASDISGGHDISIPSVISIATQLSNIRNIYVDDKYESLTPFELFYLGTKGGGEFFGKVGSFESGYEFDALVIDDTSLFDVNDRSIEERLQRYLYLGDDRNIKRKYVAGKRVFL